MEHIVQFAIGIDDQAIIDKIEDYAVKYITAELKQNITDRLFESKFGTHANPKRDPFADFAIDILLDFFKDNKDTIVKRASDTLADRLYRRKTVRDQLKESL